MIPTEILALVALAQSNNRTIATEARASLNNPRFNQALKQEVSKKNVYRRGHGYYLTANGQRLMSIIKYGRVDFQYEAEQFNKRLAMLDTLMTVISDGQEEVYEGTSYHRLLVKSKKILDDKLNSILPVTDSKHKAAQAPSLDTPVLEGKVVESVEESSVPEQSSDNEIQQESLLPDAAPVESEEISPVSEGDMLALFG